MPSAFALRLRVLVSPEQVPAGSPLSASPIRGSNGEQIQAERNAAKPREFLLLIKEPENVSLGHLANLIKDHWRQLYPAEETLQIKKLLNDAYPNAIFTVDYSVADIWVDNGRREREGFDQSGTVRVIQASSSSILTPRFQRASSVFQDIEGAAARVAKRKSSDGGRDTNGSLAATGQTAGRTPFQDDEQMDVSQSQSKRPRLTEDTDPQSASPSGVPKTTKPLPLFYNDVSVPLFAHPRGHRRHLSSTSTGSSPEKGLGLGITASPIKALASKPNITSNGSPGPSSMPPQPTPSRRRSLRGRTDSNPPQSFSQDDSPLGAKKPKVRKQSSVLGNASSKKPPRTRSSQKTPGSGEHSSRTTPSTGRNSLSKKRKPSNADWVERDRKELLEIRALLKGPRTNPECLFILQKLVDAHEEKLAIRADPALKGKKREKRMDNIRRKLNHYRDDLEKFKSDGGLLEELEVQATSSEDESTETGNDDDNDGDEESEEEMPMKAPKRRPRLGQRDLAADFAAARRISPRHGYSKSAGLGDNQRSRDSEKPDERSVQVVVKDTGSEQLSLPLRTSPAKQFPSPGLLLDGAPSQDEIAHESDGPTTDSEGGDIPFEAPGIIVDPSSLIHNSNVAQKPSPIPRPIEAELTERVTGNDGVDTTARTLELPVTRFPVSVSQEHSVELPTLRDFIQMPREMALALLFPYGTQQPQFVDTSVTSEDETSEDESSEEDGDDRM